MQSCVLRSHLKSLLSALWSLSCIVQAGHEVERKKEEQSLDVVLQLWSESWNGKPMFQNPLLNALIFCLSFVLHFLFRSCSYMLGAGCDRRAGYWEMCHWHNGSGTWAQHSPGGQNLLQSYSILPFILNDKCIAYNILQTTYQKAKQESLWVSGWRWELLRMYCQLEKCSTGLGYQPVTILCGQRRAGQPVRAWSAPCTPSTVAHSTKFGKVSRELLIINNFEIFNELERSFFGGWFMLCHLSCLLPNGVLIAFLLLVLQLKPFFTFAFIFSTSLNFPYLLLITICHFLPSVSSLHQKLCPSLLFLESRKMKFVCFRKN